jgi:hypothetical protein
MAFLGDNFKPGKTIAGILSCDAWVVRLRRQNSI